MSLQLESARDCIRRAAGSSWWEWDQGSSLFFWRWPRGYRKWALEGQPHYQTGDLPRFRRAQPPGRDPATTAKMKDKVVKVRERLYIEPGEVDSLTHMFCVPKGTDDIRT